MNDIKKSKYAPFLEAVCGSIMKYKPKAIAFEYVLENGDIGGGYYDCSVCDKLAMAGMMQLSAVRDDLAMDGESAE